MNKINAIVILIMLSCPLWGQASNITAQLELIKSSFIDNQGQLVQGGIVKGHIQLNHVSEQLVWATLKLPVGFIPGYVFQTGETWMLEVPLTPQQITLFDNFFKDEQFYILAVKGEYHTLENSPYEVIFNWSKILAHLKSNKINTIDQLQQSVNHLVTSGAIQSSQTLNNMAKKAIIFTLRRQLFDYYQTEGQLAIRLRYPIPPPSKPIKTLIHSPVYTEQARLFRVDIKSQSSQESAYNAYRIQTVQFYTVIDLKHLGIRAIALQSEMIDNKGYRQPGKMLFIKNSPFVFYKQIFTIIGEFNKYHLVYWGKILLENGSVLTLPKTRPTHFSVSTSTVELSQIVSPLLEEVVEFDDD
ncbi:hypothetical protein PN36_25025 [Candidatus Thiomargarita nelsonii]|uniref:Secreted protein n=1 Tax=Candidatus Thiomargarita nelsonii TaxID=1003181 RepID=A0A0A6PI17_9GAMM|nr:hypothetical protein PN36_25025 [Candidatus Thiomargarita nelsonii]